MRLGQLARKLSVTPSQVLDYFASISVQVENHTNARIPDAQLARVVAHFAPERMKEILAIADEPVPSQPLPVEAEAPVEPESEPAPAEPAPEPVVTHAMPVEPTPEPTELPEVIKAPKVELSGLKVLGKIDLPEPKKKEPTAEAPEETTESETVRPQERRRQTFERRPQRPQKPRKNPVALQREREEAEARRKREEELKKQKERKAQHYYKKVKPQAPTKKVKLIDEQVDVLPEMEERPKTWWGRFMKWLNT